MLFGRTLNEEATLDDVNLTYDALAPRWDDWSARVLPDVREEWAARVTAFLRAGERVVELGCGTGAPVGRMLAATYEYMGVDASAGMLARARELLPEVELVHADMLSVDVPDESLGAVIALSSVIHVPRERHADLFATVWSWLRPGGVFIASVHSRDDPDDFEAEWLGVGPMRWSGFDGATNRALLATAGFTILEHAVVEQMEPDGGHIAPMFLVAQRPS